MIIYDFSHEYQIKPFKIVTDVLELREIIHEIKSVEKIGSNPIRLLLTVNSEEIVIHYPSDVPDNISDNLEIELGNLHNKMSLFIADTIITLDILAVEIEADSDKKSYDLIIIDLLNFNGIDYRTTELRVRRRLTRTFFQGFLSSSKIKISNEIDVYNSILEIEPNNQQSQRISKHELFGYQTSSFGNWEQIMIRDESSKYNAKENNEWRLIDVQSIPPEIRGLF